MRQTDFNEDPCRSGKNLLNSCYLKGAVIPDESDKMRLTEEITNEHTCHRAAFHNARLAQTMPVALLATNLVPTLNRICRDGQ